MTTSNTNKKNTLWRSLGLLGIFVLIIAGLYVFARSQNPVISNGDKLNVVAAENFWGNIASQLGGNHVHVTSIITDPNADPHLYETNAQNAAAVSSAKVVIVNGLGYDDFMTKLLDASQNTSRQVLTASQILGVNDPGANPHLWYDIPRINTVAAKITAAYIDKDPQHKVDYQHNLQAFDRSLQPILDKINAIKQRYPNAPVAYTEPVPGYLLNSAGLAIKTPEGFAKSIEDGDDPSPADLNAFEALITNKQIKVLLYNSQATSPATEHIKDLAKQAGIPVIGVTETLPTNEHDYQSWQLSQLNALISALGA